MLFPGYLVGGRYRLVRKLGEGGMGVVWSAVNEAFGREVAIKVLLPTVATNQVAVERFLTEARICGSLRHPGIVDVIDVGNLESGAHYLVMELLDGASVDKLIDRTGTLEPLEILPIVRDAARALSLAHEKGIVHRDLKPANLFLHRLPTGTSIVKVCDFGISKVNAPETAEAGGFGGKVTKVGEVVGSPAYMSPEQAVGAENIDGRSDIWALGILMFEALTGRLPYEEPNYNALMIKIATSPPMSLRAAAPELPKSVVELVDAALAHNRDDRIATGAILADRIEAALTALGVSRAYPPPNPDASPDERPARLKNPQVETSSALSSNTHARVHGKSRRAPVIAALLATAAAAAGVTLFFARGGPSQIHGVTLPAPSAEQDTARRAGGPGAAPATTEPQVTPTVAIAAPPSALAGSSSAVTPPVVSASPASPSASASAGPKPRLTPKPAAKKPGVWSYD